MNYLERKYSVGCVNISFNISIGTKYNDPFPDFIKCCHFLKILKLHQLLIGNIVIFMTIFPIKIYHL